MSDTSRRRVVVLMRGVNVGGTRKLPMAALRSGLEGAGCTDVVTYIQSGNAVVTPPSPVPKDLQAWLERVVSGVAGFDVPVVVRTRRELERTVARNPYPDANGTQLHVVFFAAAPRRALLDGIDLASFEPEACRLVGRDLYLHLPNGMGRAKLPVALDKAARAGRSADITTSRNWNTVLKLVALAAR